MQPQGCLTVDFQLKVTLNSSPFNQKALLLTHFCWGGGLSCFFAKDALESLDSRELLL